MYSFHRLKQIIGCITIIIFWLQNAHHTLQKTHIDRRLEKLQDNADVDWATAEALAFGSLMTQGETGNIGSRIPSPLPLPASNEHVMLLQIEYINKTHSTVVSSSNLGWFYGWHKKKQELSEIILYMVSLKGVEMVWAMGR